MEPCLPPFVRRTPQGPCVRGPAPAAFGGPASGLWPSGSAPSAAVPSCITPTLFADCFLGCTGAINEFSPGPGPGPLCGWTFNTGFGPLAGSISFTSGAMSFDTKSATDFPGASKPIPVSMAGVNGLTGQFTFTEYPTAPNPSTTYDLYANNVDSSQSISMGLFGDGTISFQVGPSASAPVYSGAWTPDNGTHTVHFNVDNAGVPALFIDGVAVPLLFIGNAPSFASIFPANSVVLFIGSGDPAPTSSVVSDLFLTAGVLGPEAEFCCPA